LTVIEFCWIVYAEKTVNRYTVKGQEQIVSARACNRKDLSR
jgi:hypothetical protein